MSVGESGSPVVFCHGLFGQGRNWNQIARRLCAGDPPHRALLLDMPNHGRSPWTEGFDYVEAADLVAGMLDPADPVALVGHSMGGKIAMLVALRHPELVERLVVVDVAPVAYGHATEFDGYIAAMLGLDLEALEGRGEADAALQEAVPDPGVRAFLLQNLRREGEAWRWQPHLEMIRDHLDAITGWPEGDLGVYGGPVLWVAGERSHYVQGEYDAAMERLFPRERRVVVKGAGHWVHSEQPEIFGEVLRRFVDAGQSPV